MSNVNFYIGKIYDSNKCGKMEIIDFEGYKKSKRYFLVKFLDSGVIKSSRLDNIKIGNVNDFTPYDIVGKEFKSNNYGFVKVVEYVGKDKTSKLHFYKVKFKDSGSILIKERNYIKTGNVSDDPKKDVIGNIYENSMGFKYKVLNFEYKTNDNNYWFKVKFVSSGYKVIQSKSHVTNGEVRDRFGVRENKGFLGDANYKDNKTLYHLWNSMLSRCYNENYTSYKWYGGKGVSVCERWHCFANFLEDAPKIDGYNLDKIMDNKLCLDKDKKSFDKPYNEREYSLKNCTWLTQSENNKYKGVKTSKR